MSVIGPRLAGPLRLLSRQVSEDNRTWRGGDENDAIDPKRSLWLRQGHSENIQIVGHYDVPAVALSNLIEQHVL